MVEILEGKSLVHHVDAINSVILTKKDGPQEFGAELEARLIKEGVARPFNKVATDAGDENKDGQSNNKADNEDGSKGPEDVKLVPCPKCGFIPDAGHTFERCPECGYGGEDDPDEDEGSHDKPFYNVDTKMPELQELMKTYGLPYKVGMTKGDIIAALDAYFADAEDDGEAPPPLRAEDPIT